MSVKILPLHYYLAFFLGSFGLSTLLVPFVRKLATATGQVATPKDNRWHKKETALMGGIGIFVSYMVIWLLAVNIIGWSDLGLPYLPILLCATGIFALGMADDIMNMEPQHKLVAQIVITSLLILFGFRLNWTFSQTANLFLSIIWIVGITNAFNLLDNMDGLSGGIAFIAGFSLFIMHYANPDMSSFAAPTLLVIAIYLGAILGFLIYNFSPASIFMGDAGSLFIGFVLACMTVISKTGEPAGDRISHLLSVIAIPVLILFIPILDTGFVSFMRKLFSRPISQGGRDHSSHRLVAIGFSEKKAVLILYLLSIISGGIAIAVRYFSTSISLVIIILYLLFVLFFWIYLGRVKVYPEESILSDGERRGITPILIEITYRRRVLEVFLDLVLITFAYYSAYLLRFEGSPGSNFEYFLKSLPILIACQIFWLYLMGIYRGIWKSAGLRDLTGFIKAVTGGAVMSMLILVFVYRFYSFSRAVFVIYWVVMLILLVLSRLSFRMIDETIWKGNKNGRPTLIYGAGVWGQMAMKEIETNRDLGMILVGFIDDNPRSHRGKVQGYPVLGGHDDLEKIIKKNDIQEIIVSFRKKGLERKRAIKSSCTRMGIEVAVRQMRLIIN